MKNFIKEENLYTLKRQYSLIVPLLGTFFGLALVGFLKIPESSFKWWMLGIGILLAIAYARRSLVIDMDKREIRVVMGLFHPVRTIPLEQLQGFTVHRLKYMGFITINVSLIADYYNEEGKPKELGLAESFFKRPIQSILNDIHEVIYDEDKGATEV